LVLWATVLVDGGDRVIRYFIELKKRTKHVRYLKKKNKSINLIKTPPPKNSFRNHKPRSILYALSKLPSKIETVMIIDPDVELLDR
jgi:Uri superfamily endonuclease